MLLLMPAHERVCTARNIPTSSSSSFSRENIFSNFFFILILFLLLLPLLFSLFYLFVANFAALLGSFRPRRKWKTKTKRTSGERWKDGPPRPLSPLFFPSHALANQHSVGHTSPSTYFCLTLERSTSNSEQHTPVPTADVWT